MHQQERTRSRRNFAGGDAGERGGRGTTWSAWVPGAAKREPGRRTKVRTGTRRVGGASSARSKNTDVRGIVGLSSSELEVDEQRRPAHRSSSDMRMPRSPPY